MKSTIGSFIRIAGACALVLAPFAALAQTPLTTLNMPNGTGRIVYGVVDNSPTEASAMINVLRVVHQSCGNRPEIGSAFRLRGTNAIGLYFMVVNHPAGDIPVGGLIIAVNTSAGRVEAGLLTDRADRFHQTLTPMMQRLFSVWKPGTAVTSAYSSSGAAAASASPSVPAHAASRPGQRPSPSAPDTSGHSEPAPPLHMVTAPDNSFQIGLPSGWNLAPGSGGGKLGITGPHGEQIGLNMLKMAVDPYIAYQVTHMRTVQPIQGVMYAPYRGNLQQEFPTLFQAWRRSNGLGPVKLTVDSVVQGQPVGPQIPCVQFVTHMDANDGKGPIVFSGVMCAAMPSTTSRGDYTVQLSSFMIPQSFAERDKSTVAAIISSYRPNQSVINGQVADAQHQYNINYSALVNNIRATTAIRSKGVMDRAQIMHNSQEETNAIRQQGIDNQQDGFARSNQGQDLYIRDRTVIRDNEYPDDHAQVYNTTYNWLQQAFPDRIEEVPPSQYIKGRDF
jgi:hypothetical protein